MRLLDWLGEAYTRPLAELATHDVQPITAGRVRCPTDGRDVAEAECTSCPRYLRTHTFHGADGLWLQSAIVCDAAGANSDTAGRNS